MRMDKKKFKTDNNDEEIWLITYADLITLLLCLFIILFSAASINKGQLEKIKVSYNASVSNKTFTTTIDQVKHQMDSILMKDIAIKDVYINIDKDGISLGFMNSSLYNIGDSELSEDGKRKIERIAALLNSFKHSNFLIDVEGHTDDNPISNEKFESNWDLSVLRATNVVRYFIEKKIPAARLKASGYSDTRPLLPNRDYLGNPLFKNQAKNRRVVIKIYK